jgi:hypothetical protein
MPYSWRHRSPTARSVIAGVFLRGNCECVEVSAVPVWMSIWGVVRNCQCTYQHLGSSLSLTLFFHGSRSVFQQSNHRGSCGGCTSHRSPFPWKWNYMNWRKICESKCDLSVRLNNNVITYDFITRWSISSHLHDEALTWNSQGERTAGDGTWWMTWSPWATCTHVVNLRTKSGEKGDASLIAYAPKGQGTKGLSKYVRKSIL